jgi:hypothetical protein
MGEKDPECHLEQAERYLATRLERIRQTSVYGLRPTRTLVAGATKCLGNRAIQREADALNAIMKCVDPQTSLDEIHDGTFDSFRKARRGKGVPRERYPRSAWAALVCATRSSHDG